MRGWRVLTIRSRRASEPDGPSQKAVQVLVSTQSPEPVTLVPCAGVPSVGTADPFEYSSSLR
jgi:hypothetical protein